MTSPFFQPILSVLNAGLMALNESHRIQLVLNFGGKMASDLLENVSDRLCILDQLADVLVKQKQEIMESQLYDIRKWAQG